MGHNAPFAFTPDYTPSTDLRRLTVGTPSVLGMIALETALEVFENVSMQDIRTKSIALTDLFIDLMQPLCLEFGFELVSPRESIRRGSQVSYAHKEGYAIMQALIAADVIGDFRAPNIVRFGFTPLYLQFADVQEAVQRLEVIMRENRWQEAQFQERSKVT
jgi:kynureninase